MLVRRRLTLGDGRHELLSDTVPPSRMLITPSRLLTRTVTRTLPLRGRGAQFDPMVVDGLIAVQERQPAAA